MPVIFSIKGEVVQGEPSAFYLLSQLLTKLLLTMKFAFALLPIAAAALGFVQAGPVQVVDESLVCASILPSNIFHAHY